MARTLTADDLLGGATVVHDIPLPAQLVTGETAEGAAEPAIAGQVSLRPLTLKDVQRITKAAREGQALTSILMVQQAMVQPRLTVEQVSALPAGLARFLLEQVNAVSGLDLGDDELDAAVKAPLVRACFVLSREFGWTPTDCAELTIGQALLYLEMIARGEQPEAAA
jgi:hypothetical protein